MTASVVLIHNLIFMIALTISYTSQNVLSKVQIETKLNGKIVYGACNKLFVYNLNTNKSKLIYTHKRKDGKDWLCHVQRPEWINKGASIAFYVECLIYPKNIEYQHFRFFTIDENGKGISEMNHLYENNGYSLYPLTEFNKHLNGYIIAKNCRHDNDDYVCDQYLSSYNAKSNKWYFKRLARSNTHGYSNNRKLRVYIENGMKLRFSNKGTIIYTINKSDFETLLDSDVVWSNDDKYIAFIVTRVGRLNKTINGRKRVIITNEGGKICIYNVVKQNFKCKELPTIKAGGYYFIHWSNSNSRIYFTSDAKAYIYNLHNNTLGVFYDDGYLTDYVTFLNDNYLVATTSDRSKRLDFDVWSKYGCNRQLSSNYHRQMVIFDINKKQIKYLVPASSVSNNSYKR